MKGWVMGRRKRKRPPKRTCQKLHAYKRIKERFGIDMLREEYDELVRMIRTGRTEGVRETLRVAHHTVKVRGKEMVAVYDRQRESIVTFLTLEMSADRMGREPPPPPKMPKVRKLVDASRPETEEEIDRVRRKLESRSLDDAFQFSLKTRDMWQG